MIFISLVRMKHKPTKEVQQDGDRLWASMEKEGLKVISKYYTLGHYDVVVISEAPNERVFMKGIMKHMEHISSQTLIAIPRDEAKKLVD